MKGRLPGGSGKILILTIKRGSVHSQHDQQYREVLIVLNLSEAGFLNFNTIGVWPHHPLVGAILHDVGLLAASLASTH